MTSGRRTARSRSGSHTAASLTVRDVCRGPSTFTGLGRRASVVRGRPLVSTHVAVNGRGQARRQTRHCLDALTLSANRALARLVFVHLMELFPPCAVIVSSGKDNWWITQRRGALRCPGGRVHGAGPARITAARYGVDSPWSRSGLTCSGGWMSGSLCAHGGNTVSVRQPHLGHG